MSFGANHAPLIILSNSIYAKRRDGSFYPGSVESKHDECYIVKFADGARERIHEENLTWLGFWGLPPWNWPKSPVIQPVVSSWEAFESQTMCVKDTGVARRTAASANELRREQSRRFCGDEETTAAPDSLGESLDKTNDEEFPSHLLPEHADFNQRSSVLRINSNALTKDGSREAFLSHTTTEEETCSATTSRSPSPSTQNVHDKERQSDLQTACMASAPTYSRSSTSPDGAFHRNREHECPSEKARYRYFLERRSSSERGAEDEDIRLDEPDYCTKDVHRSSYSPPRNPSHFFSSPLPLFSQQLGMTMIGASPHAVIPTSFRLQMKMRRKDEKKKCRKVYGIENRHFWCTQCKWKKACTRFTTGSKIIANGFV